MLKNDDILEDLVKAELQDEDFAAAADFIEADGEGLFDIKFSIPFIRFQQRYCFLKVFALKFLDD